MTVTTASGDWQLHSLLLASRSEFFHAALAGDFSESRSKTIELHLEKCEDVWPLVVDYFYSDSITVDEGNACALLALSRQLLISQLDGFCTDFLQRHLSTPNCLSYLRQVCDVWPSGGEWRCVSTSRCLCGWVVVLLWRQSCVRCVAACPQTSPHHATSPSAATCPFLCCP